MNEDVWKEHEDQDSSWFDVSNRDLALGLFGEHDLEAQLLAITGLLSRNQQDDEALEAKIKQLDKDARANARRSAMYRLQLEDERLDSLHHSVFQDAAHSMAAVGMLAPFIESLFVSIFGALRKYEKSNDVPLLNDARINASQNEFWDPHFVFHGKGRRRGIVAGIEQLTGTTGLSEYLPCGYVKVLSALFTYRNKMFHLGFEWPKDERMKFDRRVNSGEWPAEWFRKATSGDKPWIFYMSEDFIFHCLKTIDEVLDGVGAYMKKQLS